MKVCRRRRISAERQQLQPSAKTCSPECSAANRRELQRRSAARRRERRKQVSVTWRYRMAGGMSNIAY